ncbi:hypothetical protein [Staphylococcus capitis]
MTEITFKKYSNNFLSKKEKKKEIESDFNILKKNLNKIKLKK